MTAQNRQKGMTLLEVTVAMAVSGLIMTGALSLIFQEWEGSAIAKTLVSAAHEIGYSARLISQDVMMAESTDLVEGAPPADRVTLTWIDRYDFLNIPHSSSYYLSGTHLQRNHDGTVTTIAREISQIEFSQTGRLVTVSISCTPEWATSQKTVQKTYRIYLRPTNGG